VRRGTFVCGALCLLAGAARADRSVDAQLYKSALDPFGIFGIERAQGPERYDLGFQLGVGYAHAPLKLEVPNIGTPDDRDAVLASQLLLDLNLSFGLTDTLTFAFGVPIQRQPLGDGYGEPGMYKPVPIDDPTAQPGTGFWSSREGQNPDPSVNTPGDVRVGLKWRLGSGALRLGVQGVVYVPFGDEDVFAGSKGFTYEPKLIGEVLLGRAVIALNAGARLRKGTLVETRQVDADGTVMNDEDGNAVYQPLLYVGSEALVGLGARLPLGNTVSLSASATALIPIATASGEECPDGCKNGDFAADAIAGLGFELRPGTTLSVGGGVGVIPGAARAETFRAVASLAWTPSAAGAGVSSRGDRDKDGVPDSVDVCLDDDEDKDGFQDEDGCPELDNDLDGVLDNVDKCAAEAEDRDGFKDDDGCPDADDDEDGVADLVDRCPRQAEDVDEIQDDDGCPDDDNDGDGIVDAKDKCPTEPETLNGVDDADGCPDQAVQGGPRLTADRIDLQGERIDFVGRTARFAPGAGQTLDAIAQIFVADPSLRVRIEVGVERTGNRPRDRQRDYKVSADRAAAVQQALVQRGVKATQLDVAPLGATRPLDPKRPNDPRVNRRVDFIRVTQ
jgi:outer membrane protein OmpA-like peptidoglycan-associated protein